jgi:pyridoxine 5-phosphate synthase
MTVLSVNLNKIAVLRNSRGGKDPDVLTAGKVCLDAGAHGLTVHPRPDARHIRSDDVFILAELCAARGVEFNIEGNPFAPPRPGYPGLYALCETVRPAQVTFVPDADGQLTSDHGFDFTGSTDALGALIHRFKTLGCRVSTFVDVGDPQVAQAAMLGADRVELYTGPYAEAFANGDSAAVLAAAASTVALASAAGLAINAGHDLNQDNLPVLLRHIPDIAEVSIGHALISDALYAGMAATVRAYRDIVDQSSA